MPFSSISPRVSNVSNVSLLPQTIASRVSDVEGAVRQEAINLLRSQVLTALCSEAMLSPHMPLLALALGAAMTSVDSARVFHPRLVQ